MHFARKKNPASESRWFCFGGRLNKNWQS